MKLVIYALIFTIVAAENECPGVYINGRYHDVEVIKEGINHVHELELNRNENILYFTFEQLSSLPSTLLGYIDLSTREAGVIDGIRNATSIAIDQGLNHVYVGSQDGIFRINEHKIAVKLPVHDHIQNVFYKDVLFYTNNRNQAYMFDNGHINPVFELQYVHPEKLILDDDYNIFFTEGKSLFRVRLGTRVVNTHERHKVDVLTTDADFKPYISTKDGIYTYNKYKYVFDKVSDITGLKALTFNKDGEAIYAVVDVLIKLKYNPASCIRN